MADDVVTFERIGNQVTGHCPEALQDKLEIRGLGIINLRKLVGDHVIAPNSPLNTVIELNSNNQEEERILEPVVKDSNIRASF